MHARGRPNTPKLGDGGHRRIERSMRPRVVHGVMRSGAPRRSRSQQPVLEATPPPAPLHRAEALELGKLNRLTYLVVSPGCIFGSGFRLTFSVPHCPHGLTAHGLIFTCKTSYALAVEGAVGGGAGSSARSWVVDAADASAIAAPCALRRLQGGIEQVPGRRWQRRRGLSAP